MKFYDHIVIFLSVTLVAVIALGIVLGKLSEIEDLVDHQADSIEAQQ